LSHVQRVEAGRVLGKLGDARPEITLEGMQFCPVPAGAFLMGEEEEEGEYNVRWPFWMGRYPITNGQYQQFVEDGGYEMEALWKEAGEAGCWKDGHIEDWLGTTTAGPEQYGDPFGFHNHPVVGVTWYECLAFTRWLSRYWTKQATHSIPAGWEFRLPTEPEWEKAAKGGILTRQPFTGSVNADLFPSADMLALHLEANKHNSIETQDNPNTNRSYPWGRSEDEDACSPERLNFGDSDLHSTNAIGAYPTGASDYGCEEMSGGVWEWMMNKYAGYPYDPKDDREKVDEKEDSRVLRGGSFANGSLYVRCAYRGWDGPDYRDYSLGFRILCSPITSDL
ncbi:MAG: SUMF1/EgtB/PvdO family nonheme iron enzyme, partial [Planctomycetota bacterium]|nr:SUMF1/EgtB/PvdO family nonheme iron enzyme [Planctomycetota bacterium]